MPGQSPLDMMRTDRPRKDLRPAGAAPRRRTSLVLWAVAAVIVLAAVWSGLWYYAARVADRTLSGWVAREAAAGRTYTCGSQGISGFPFRIEATASTPPPWSPAASRRSHSPQRASSSRRGLPSDAADRRSDGAIHFGGDRPAAELCRRLVAGSNQRARFAAGARTGNGHVQAAPPSIRLPLRKTRWSSKPTKRKSSGRLIGGAADNNPVIETTLRFTAAAAPTLHPLLADPMKGDIDAIVRGFKDLLPKPWAVRFREMQAAGGTIEIKAFRIERHRRDRGRHRHADRQRARQSRRPHPCCHGGHREHRAAVGHRQSDRSRHRPAGGIGSGCTSTG